MALCCLAAFASTAWMCICSWAMCLRTLVSNTPIEARVFTFPMSCRESSYRSLTSTQCSLTGPHQGGPRGDSNSTTESLPE